MFLQLGLIVTKNDRIVLKILTSILKRYYTLLLIVIYKKSSVVYHQVPLPKNATSKHGFLER
jgi:hypothetical protein